MKNCENGLIIRDLFAYFCIENKVTFNEENVRKISKKINSAWKDVNSGVKYGT